LDARNEYIDIGRFSDSFDALYANELASVQLNAPAVACFLVAAGTLQQLHHARLS
jgi:hypothetical protein